MNKITCLLALLMCQISANAEVTSVSEGGFISENVVEIPVAPDAVWTHLVNDVDSWWPKDHSWWEGTFSIDPVAGGCFCENAGSRSAEHMRISLVDTGKLLRMTGGLGPLQGLGLYGALDWLLEKTATGTKITLTYRVHGYLPGGYEKLAPIVASVQKIQLQGLADFATQSALE